MEQIWYRDIISFFNMDKIAVFIPKYDMTFVERLNAVMRFSIYFSGILFLVKKNILVWYFAIFIGFCTVFLHEMYARNMRLHKELFKKNNIMYDKVNDGFCSLPSKDNPFMNVLINEYSESPNRPQACNINSSSVKKIAEKHFNRNLYRDVDDVWSRKSNSRNWHTVPNTQIPNKQTEFAEWLYKLGPTCKEGNGNICYQNTHNPLRK